MAQLPRWASDENFPAGSKPWNGQPTRLEPLNTIKARGFTPTDVPPAQAHNWLFGVLFDESNDQDTRLTAAEKRTLQDAYDASVVMVGDTPTGTLDVPRDYALVIAGEGLREIKSSRAGVASVRLVPFAAGDEVMRVNNGGKINFQGATDGAFLVGPADDTMTHGITTPPTPNTTSKGALVRAPGTGSQATEWMPMDWGDTDGGGSGWTHGATGANAVSGRWQRVGDVITFSISGTTDFAGAGPSSATITFDIPLGGTDAHAQANAGTIASGSADSGVAGSSGSTVIVNFSDALAFGSDVPWVVTGTAKV